MKHIVKDALIAMAGKVYRERPVRRWPRWIGDLFVVKVPANLVGKPEPSPSGGANINILLELVDAVAGVQGDIAECGVFRGGTLIPMALYLRQNGMRKQIFGLDSFEGFGEDVSIDIKLGGAPDVEKRPGGFNSTSYEFVARRAEALGFGAGLTIIKGYFDHTLKQLEGRRFSLVHLDCDIYESYKCCLEFFYPLMSPGGIVLIDEYDDPPWPGCRKAVDEFLGGKAEKLELIQRDNYQKFFFRKQ